LIFEVRGGFGDSKNQQKSTKFGSGELREPQNGVKTGQGRPRTPEMGHRERCWRQNWDNMTDFGAQEGQNSKKDCKEHLKIFYDVSF